MLVRNFASLLVLIIAALFGVATSNSSPSGSSGSSPSTPPTPDLNASVRFTGTQFIITNNDSFAWSNCKLEINSKVFGSGYTYVGANIAAGATYSVGALQFANGDGQRFNPFTLKPQNLSISCNTPNGRGFYYGGWK